MKKEKLSFALKVFIMTISMIFVCAIIIIPTIKFDAKSIDNSVRVDKNYETNAGSIEMPKHSNDGNKNSENLKTLKFFINEHSVLKTKKFVGEVTEFTLNLKVIVSNETDTAKTINASDFGGFYDISEYTSFYKIEFNKDEEVKTILPEECESFELTFIYFVDDVENFKEYLKYDLSIHYMLTEVVLKQV